VGIVGAGLIGAKRGRALAGRQDSQLIAVVDQDPERASSVAREHGCEVGTTWRDLVARPDIDIVVVATSHDWLARISLEALRACKHVLCEKPLAINLMEAQRLVECASRSKFKLKVGFNHRFHPAVRQAHALAQEGQIGRLLFIRCRYGHGGRPGYDREWRADPQRSGGGELLDQGIHALDLFRWFLGEFSEVYAVVTTAFWKMAVEDNAFCTLRTSKGQVASLHASWTQWKNIFSLEVVGERGYLIAEGLGGSYGPERLLFGRRPLKFGKPNEQIIEFEDEENCWAYEWSEFVAAIREDRRPLGDGYDGWQAFRLVQAAYESSLQRRAIVLS